MQHWREHWERKKIMAEEAAAKVKPGDRVVFPMGRETFAIGLALAARKGELQDVQVVVPWPAYDFGWYDHSWQDSFQVEISGPTAVAEEALQARRCDLALPMLIPDPMTTDVRPPDIIFVEISTPDERGFCSFGASLWDKKRRVQQAKEVGIPVIAEVNPNLIRTYGDNFVHVSEIDYFVEHISSGGAPGARGSLAGRKSKEPETYVRPMVEILNTLISNGDTIQIGVGRTTEPMVRMGLLKGKEDIGYHSEATPPGIISLVREGVISGRCKTLNPGIVVVTALGGSTREEMEWANSNPLFHLMDVKYVEDIRVISAHDSYVAINQALAVDLPGQITAESLGPRIVAAAGGQIPFVFGALLSNGGRSITVLPSTAKEGKVSRIVPLFPEGTVVTIQRNCADLVVTEYGVARLRGKSIRRRAEELISVAHPDFRSKLRKEAQKLFWP